MRTLAHRSELGEVARRARRTRGSIENQWRCVLLLFFLLDELDELRPPRVETFPPNIYSRRGQRARRDGFVEGARSKNGSPRPGATSPNGPPPPWPESRELCEYLASQGAFGGNLLSWCAFGEIVSVRNRHIRGLGLPLPGVCAQPTH